MGEYALYRDEEVKIGTCEEMLYLRADQAHLVTPLRGNVDPVRDAVRLRFRFPFPDEDHVAPGHFDTERSVPIHAPLPERCSDHGLVQFVSSRGYNVCLPCPETPDVGEHGLKVHRNGFPGPTRVAFQKFDGGGHMATVVECQGCGHAWSMPTLADAQWLIDALRSEGDRKRHWLPKLDDPAGARWWHDIADRVLAGYTQPAPFVAATALR